MSQRFLLLAGIGPVQEFIAAARRVRDLAYGSRLLSELSKACARSLNERFPQGPDLGLIFPFSSNLDADLAQGSSYSVTNKILAIVRADSESGMRELAADLRRAVREEIAVRFQSAFIEALRRLQPSGIRIRQDRITRQVDGLEEFYAAWAPLPNLDQYPEARRLVERRLAERKTLRDFSRYDGEPIPKSSLDGIRETVIEHSQSPVSRPQFHVRPNELLDAVGLLKRFAETRNMDLKFESTVDVAAGPYVSRLRREHPDFETRYRALLAEHRDQIPFSFGYLYPHESRQFESESLAYALRQLVQPYRLRVPETPYYAFLLGDGDSMGERISELKTVQAHRDFSERLSRFANRAQEALDNEFEGEAVYAGGDDVVALLPLHRALDGAYAVRQAFSNAFEGYAQAPTFSAGLVVAHAMEPLNEVRQLAFQAERYAKQFQSQARKKDALAVLVSPRSGADVQCVGPWGLMHERLSRIARLYANRELTRNLGHEFRRLLVEVQDEGLNSALAPLAVAIAKKKESNREAVKLLEWVGEENPREDLENLSQLLFVARPFGRAIQEAGI